MQVYSAGGSILRPRRARDPIWGVSLSTPWCRTCLPFRADPKLKDNEDAPRNPSSSATTCNQGATLPSLFSALERFHVGEEEKPTASPPGGLVLRTEGP